MAKLSQSQRGQQLGNNESSTVVRKKSNKRSLSRTPKQSKRVSFQEIYDY